MTGLSALQEDFLTGFFCVTQDFYLTGGAALIGFYGLPRMTGDLDLFATSEGALDHVSAAVAQTATAIGATWTQIRSAPYFHRYQVQRDGKNLQVDLVYEPTPQLHPDKPLQRGIRVDPLDEIMANKICTLVGRAEVRDFWDIHQLAGRGLDINQALRDASRKEGGVDAESLLFVLQGVEWRAFEDAAHAAGLSEPHAVATYFQQFARELALRLLPQIESMNS